jgi:hypothetical protein
VPVCHFHCFERANYGLAELSTTGNGQLHPVCIHKAKPFFLSINRWGANDQYYYASKNSILPVPSRWKFLIRTQANIATAHKLLRKLTSVYRVGLLAGVEVDQTWRIPASKPCWRVRGVLVYFSSCSGAEGLPACLPYMGWGDAFVCAWGRSWAPWSLFPQPEHSCRWVCVVEMHPRRLFQPLQSIMPSLPSSVFRHLALLPSQNVSELQLRALCGLVDKHRAQTTW